MRDYCWASERDEFEKRKMKPLGFWVKGRKYSHHMEREDPYARERWTPTGESKNYDTLTIILTSLYSSKQKKFTIYHSSVWKRTNLKLFLSSKANIILLFSNLVNFGCMI